MAVTMLPEDIKTLQQIQDVDSLVEYLRDELNWPLTADDIDDLTFDYAPEELGLEQQHVVKLRSVKQLRPLVSNQPWGIFFLEFEPKKLPVVVLRRILRELVPKRRLSSNASELAVWNKGDLLFVSAMGEQSHRRISFAHFRDDASGTPVLETFDWDDHETQFNSIGLSLSKLHWPSNAADLTNWRQEWSAAFTKPHGYVVETARDLSLRLAELASRVRNRVQEIYDVERKSGPLHNLYEAFKAALVHDLEVAVFSDMLAQTVAYGLFAARTETGQVLGLSNLAHMIPATNPFLRELFGEIENLGSDKTSYVNFDELGVSDIAELLNNAKMDVILADFGRQTSDGREDPVIHFYESFLKEYDVKQRIERGVFYTPKPVVSFIVRSVDRILRDEFGLSDGLADTSTWGQMQSRYPSLNLPKGVTLDMPFVQILDPATGTGTFLEMVIQVIWETMTDKWRMEHKNKEQILAAWNEYVPKHLLPRLNGFELMMAPYAIAHVKLGLKLKLLGYDFQSGERLRVFLTNTLEEPDELGRQGVVQKNWMNAFNFLAHESRAAGSVKRSCGITVVVGNPPYSYESANIGGFISELVRDYYTVDGQPLGERNPRGLQDDYVKFIRIAQWFLGKAGVGVLGYITNHGYLNNPTFRGMRQSLLTAFPLVDVVDLHGNSKWKEQNPHGANDENVFDIQQGVAIGFFRKTPIVSNEVVRHSDLWGRREEKAEVLYSTGYADIGSLVITPQAQQYYLVNHDQTMAAEYERYLPITSIMPINSVGLYTARDEFVIQIERDEILPLLREFISITPENARNRFGLGPDSEDWKVHLAQTDVRESGPNQTHVCRISYRPFDDRATYYTGVSRGLMCRPRGEIMQHMISTPNLALCFMRRSREQVVTNFWVATGLIDKTILSSADNASFAPLYLNRGNGNISVNFSGGFLDLLGQRIGVTMSSPSRVATHGEPKNDADLILTLGMFDEFHGLFRANPKGDPAECLEAPEQRLEVSPVDVLAYIYAIFYSRIYRTRYSELLKNDFPRVPVTSNTSLFSALVSCGQKILNLHTTLANATNPAARLSPTGTSSVDAAPNYVYAEALSEGRVYINKTQYFSPVPQEVWEFHVGGYQVCHKWLKDRKGRTLTAEDIAHYGRIVAALGETIRLMGEIDEVIDEHGGWPLQ